MHDYISENFDNSFMKYFIFDAATWNNFCTKLFMCIFTLTKYNLFKATVATSRTMTIHFVLSGFSFVDTVS